jgi:hydrogenase nickel incorporation protein HypB
MCETCGCEEHGEFTVKKADGKIIWDNSDDHLHSHDEEHDHTHHHDHSHPHGHDHHTHASKKTIDINADILSGNDITAAMNRRFFEGRSVFCINLVSSPGSGKTTILENTIRQLSGSGKIYVIEGDQQTLLDSARIEKAGAPAVQVNTGSGCHLDAHMIEKAVSALSLEQGSILFIENVGNLVCPALYDLGENKRVLISSVTEGEDKPLKYPLMFEKSHLCLINKTDLAPYVDFRQDLFIKNALSVNPAIEIILLSARTGDGMDRWYDWVRNQLGA